MYYSKRIPKKNRKTKRTKLFLIILIFVICILALLILLFISFTLNKNNYISPISENKVSKVSTLTNIIENNDIKFNKILPNSDGSWRILLNTGGEVIISSNKDYRTQVSSLQLILSRLTIEGKKLKTLDLRFNYPVITF